VSFRKLFSDSVYGSPEAALAAAIEWRARAVMLFPHRDRREWANLERKNNSSGHVGVFRVKTDTRVDGTPTYSWVASWCPVPGQPNKRRHKTFSIPKYGDEVAFRLAVEAREKAIANLDAKWPVGSLHRIRDSESRRRALDAEEGPTALEGAIKLRLHETRERDPSIRQQKIDDFISKYGSLYCEICTFSFHATYGILGEGLIEVHHLLPLAEMNENHLTRLEELMCICSNCHRAIHNGDPTENLDSLRFIFDAKMRADNNAIHRSRGSAVS